MIDMSQFSAAAVQQFVAIGTHYGSDRTEAQATKSLDAARVWGDVLKPYGFDAADVQQIATAKEQLQQLQLTRVDAKVNRKQTSYEFTDSLRHGKTLKNAGRQLLQNSQQTLFESNDPEKQEENQKALQQVNAALSELRPIGYDRAELARQLDLIHRTLQLAPVQATLLDNGSAIIDQLAPTAERLRAALDTVHTTPRVGTPEHTRLLDFWDGLIVIRCRKLRRIARTGAKMLGNEEIARAFELDHLRPRSRRASSSNGDTPVTATPKPPSPLPPKPLPITDPAPLAGMKTGTGEG